jgi:Protein of unknown function (DUF3099)
MFDLGRGPRGAYTVTDAKRPMSEDISYRQKRYLIMMGVRVAGLVLAVFLFHGVWRFVAAAVAIVMPYFAVVFANGGREPDNRRFEPYEPERRQLGAASPDQASPSDQGTPDQGAPDQSSPSDQSAADRGPSGQWDERDGAAQRGRRDAGGSWDGADGRPGAGTQSDSEDSLADGERSMTGEKGAAGHANQSRTRSNRA